MLKKYFWNLLIAVDQSVNTIFGGDPQETISSRLGKWAITGENKTGPRKYIYIVINFIVNLFQKNHFAKSIEPNVGSNDVIE